MPCPHPCRQAGSGAPACGAAPRAGAGGRPRGWVSRRSRGGNRPRPAGRGCSRQRRRVLATHPRRQIRGGDAEPHRLLLVLQEGERPAQAGALAAAVPADPEEPAQGDEHPAEAQPQVAQHIDGEDQHEAPRKLRHQSRHVHAQQRWRRLRHGVRSRPVLRGGILGGPRAGGLLSGCPAHATAAAAPSAAAAPPAAPPPGALAASGQGAGRRRRLLASRARPRSPRSGTTRRRFRARPAQLRPPLPPGGAGSAPAAAIGARPPHERLCLPPPPPRAASSPPLRRSSVPRRPAREARARAAAGTRGRSGPLPGALGAARPPGMREQERGSGATARKGALGGWQERTSVSRRVCASSWANHTVCRSLQAPKRLDALYLLQPSRLVFKLLMGIIKGEADQCLRGTRRWSLRASVTTGVS